MFVCVCGCVLWVDVSAHTVEGGRAEQSKSGLPHPPSPQKKTNTRRGAELTGVDFKLATGGIVQNLDPALPRNHDAIAPAGTVGVINKGGYAVVKLVLAAGFRGDWISETDANVFRSPCPILPTQPQDITSHCRIVTLQLRA